MTTEQNPYPDQIQLAPAPPVPLNALGTAGFVLALIGLVISILWLAVFSKAAGDVNKQANEVVTLHYEVTGDAKNVNISYSTYGDSGSANSSQESVTTLPWTKELQVKGLLKGGSLTVTADADGGTVECKVLVTGKQAKTSSSSGPFATAFCSDF